jgi:hypothetical protein
MDQQIRPPGETLQTKKQGQQPQPQHLKPEPTAKIQQMLEENAFMLRAIVEAQSLGRWEDCNKYQQLLHKKLSYLAALADAQQRARGAKPQAPGAMPTKPPSPVKR